MTTQIHSNLNILRLPKVLARTGSARSTHYVHIAEGTFTPPVNIGARAVGWPEYEVDAIVAALISGKSVDELRALVKELLSARKSISSKLGRQPDFVAHTP